VPIPARTVDLVRTHLDQCAAHPKTGHNLACDRTGADPRRRLTRRSPSAAAVIVDAVLDVVGVAGVPGTILVLDVGVVPRALVDIFDHQHDRRTGRHLLTGLFVGKHPRHDFYRVRLLPLCRKTGLAGAPPVEFALNVLNAKWNPRRTTIDHAADCRPVAFAKARKPEQMTESIE